ISRSRVQLPPAPPAPVLVVLPPPVAATSSAMQLLRAACSLAQSGEPHAPLTQAWLFASATHAKAASSCLVQPRFSASPFAWSHLDGQVSAPKPHTSAPRSHAAMQSSFEQPPTVLAKSTAIVNSQPLPIVVPPVRCSRYPAQETSTIINVSSGASRETGGVRGASSVPSRLGGLTGSAPSRTFEPAILGQTPRARDVADGVAARVPSAGDAPSDPLAAIGVLRRSAAVDRRAADGAAGGTAGAGFERGDVG